MTIWTHDGSGRITSSTGTIDTTVGGIPFDSSGAIVVTDGTLAPSHFINGWPVESTGKVAIHVGGTIDVYQNGLPLTSTGRLVTDNTNAVEGTKNGIPYTSSGVSIA